MSALAVLWSLCAFVVVATLLKWTWRFLREGLKVRCPACDGTGLCELGGDEVAPHACCNPECEGELVPREWVPVDYDKSRLYQGHYAVVGRGYVWGSLVARVARGGPRERLGYREGDEHPLPAKTVAAGLACLHQGARDG